MKIHFYFVHVHVQVHVIEQVLIMKNLMIMKILLSVLFGLFSRVMLCKRDCLVLQVKNSEFVLYLQKEK